MEIHILYLGKITCKKDALVKCENQDEMIDSPINAILIKHPKLGNILYDTGNSPFYATEYSKYSLDHYPIPEFIPITDALKDIGMTVEDIDMIIISHLHFDHVGGLRYFKGTKAFSNVLVSEAGLKDAYYKIMTGNPGAYARPTFDIDGLCFKCLNKDTDLSEDIHLFLQECHTPGLIGLILETESNGTIIATSDTVYTNESYVDELPPGGTINETDDEFFMNLKKLKELQKEHNATMYYGHDYELTKKWATREDGVSFSEMN